MTDRNREQLKRIAYGPDAKPQARAEAESSLRELEARALAQELALAAESAAQSDSVGAPEQFGEVDGETIGIEGINDADDIDDDGEEPSLWGRRIRVGWIVPIVVGAVLLGGVGAWSVSVGAGPFASTSSESPSPKPSPSATEWLVSPLAGDLIAADRWFDRPFEPSDAFPESGPLEPDSVDEQDVRLALDGGELGGVWVGRAADKLCLFISNGRGDGSAGTCMERSRFQAYGISLGSNDLSAHWNGWEVTSDPYIAPRPWVSAPGSGDVDAANLWFERPPTEDDVYPESGILDQMGVSQSQVRLVGHGENGPKVWAVKQGTIGFCLASYDLTQDRGQGQGKGEWNCATMEEFEAHGVTLSTSNVAAAWDGSAVSMSGG